MLLSTENRVLSTDEIAAGGCFLEIFVTIFLSDSNSLNVPLSVNMNNSEHKLLLAERIIRLK